MLKLTLALAFGLSCLPLPAAENLAAGKPVALCPLPNEPTCTAGGTDLQDLTDGRLTQRADQCMWFETLAVGWSLVPVANVQIDLGAVRAIGEVALRFLGGSPQSGIEFPGFVKLLVSDDADAWYQVAEYSKWRPGDPERFGIPASAGKAWVHPLRFADLKTRGRYVGIALGGTGLVCSDEFYVYAGDHDPAAAAFTPEQAADFSVSRPQVAFVKPRLTLTSNLATPQPLVLLDGSGEKRPVTLHLEAPPGVQLLSGQVGDTAVTPSAAVNAAETTAQGTRYTVSLQTPGKSAFPWGKLWLRAELPPGTETSLRCRLEWNGRQSQALTVPATVIEIPPAPQCRRLMMALGWWPMADTAAWPGDGLKAARIIGLNTLSTFTMWMNKQDPTLWDFAHQAKAEGFRLLNVDSAVHRIMDLHPGDTSPCCQFADGTTGKSFCPSYRGPWYAEELKRVADDNVRLQADYLSQDIELWNWQGPIDAEKCTRCQADREKSGLTWEQWKLEKGYELWRDMHQAVQEAAQAAGLERVEMGCYDFRPGRNYQFFWPFDRLYADKLIHNAQVSTYTPLLPYHIELVGNEVREDRKRLPRTDILPWLTPGDSGAFTAEALRCAMLECFLNGSRGIHFWSNRYWDGEYFLGYNQAVRAVAAVEDIIVDGQLYDKAVVDRPARVSGMSRGNDVALLVAEYYGSKPVTVTVNLEVPAASDVLDAETGEKLGALAAGKQTLAVKLDEHRSRVLWIKGK